MKTRRVFTVGQGVDSKVAQKLGQHFYSYTQIQAVALSRDDAFDDISQPDLHTLVFLGHSNGSEYGSYNPNAFASHLAHFFKNKKELKQQVEHLYLIGCDVGLMTEEHQSLAQQIVNELYNQGFTKAQVHSVARPEGSVGQSLFVEVIARRGVADILGRHQVGYLIAYLLDKEQGEEYGRLLEKTSHSGKFKAAEFKEKNAFVFLDGVHPYVELSKPHHIFIANETLGQRKERIANHPYTQITQDHQIAIDCLEKRRIYEESKGRKNYAYTINLILNQLKRAESGDWQRLLKSFKSSRSMSMLRLTLNPKSNTLALIDELCKGNMDEACGMVKDLDKKGKSKHKKENVVQGLFARVNIDETKSLLKKKPSFHRDKNKKTRIVEVEDPPSIQDKPRKNSKEWLLLNGVKQEIRALMDTLDQEIAGLQESFFSCFYGYEITTKLTKRNALNTLLNQNDVHALQNQARSYINHDERVMRSWRTNRVSDLLQKIANRVEGFAVPVERNDLNVV